MADIYEDYEAPRFSPARTDELSAWFDYIDKLVVSLGLAEDAEDDEAVLVVKTLLVHADRTLDRKLAAISSEVAA